MSSALYFYPSHSLQSNKYGVYRVHFSSIFIHLIKNCKINCFSRFFFWILPSDIFFFFFFRKCGLHNSKRIFLHVSCIYSTFTVSHVWTVRQTLEKGFNILHDFIYILFINSIPCCVGLEHAKMFLQALYWYSIKKRYKRLTYFLNLKSYK